MFVKCTFTLTEVQCYFQLVHDTVVDTSVTFPHRLGPPYKRALQTLMAEILQRIIQNDGKLFFNILSRALVFVCTYLTDRLGSNSFK